MKTYAVAFAPEAEDDLAGIMTVLGVYYGGRDYESVFGGGENSAPDRK